MRRRALSLFPRRASAWLLMAPIPSMVSPMRPTFGTQEAPAQPTSPVRRSTATIENVANAGAATASVSADAATTRARREFDLMVLTFPSMTSAGRCLSLVGRRRDVLDRGPARDRDGAAALL